MSKEDLRNYQLQLDQVDDGLSISPDDSELLSLKEELTELINLLKEELKVEEAVQETKNQKWLQKAKPQQPKPTHSPNSTSPPAETDSPDPSSTPKQEIFKVGDVVSAKWLSGDGAFYAAKVTQVTGHSTKPNYTVKFLKWEDTPMETVPYYHVKPLKEDAKRKATAAGYDKPPPPKKIDPQAREAAEEKKRRKLREKQELEKTKQNWQSFAARGPKKRTGTVGKAAPIGSNSMFKTPESHGGRGMFSSLLRTVC